MSEYQAGVTAPPFHPWCRGCTVPYFDDDIGERAARDPETDKTYYVPSDMKYEEWNAVYVECGEKSGLTKAGNDVKINSGGDVVNVLPNADNAVIPLKEFTEYALHPIKGKGKAYAFEHALGYDLSNADKLIDNIRQNIKNFEAVAKGENDFGLKYEVMMELLGVNGKTANVLTSWIVENESGNTRLTSVYIKNRRRAK